MVAKPWLASELIRAQGFVQRVLLFDALKTLVSPHQTDDINNSASYRKR